MPKDEKAKEEMRVFAISYAARHPGLTLVGNDVPKNARSTFVHIGLSLNSILWKRQISLRARVLQERGLIP